MNTPVHSLRDTLAKRFPNARVWVDEPVREGGIWHLTIVQGSVQIYIYWLDGKGLWISTDENAPDRPVETEKQAVEEVEFLLGE